MCSREGAILMLGKTVGKLTGGQSNLAEHPAQHRVFKRVHINLQTRTITGLQPAELGVKSSEELSEVLIFLLLITTNQLELVKSSFCI